MFQKPLLAHHDLRNDHDVWSSIKRLFDEHPRGIPNRARA
jgi:hypothetical protein